MPTIGVAIAIPEPWGAELQDRRESFGDRTATSIPTHVTLVPPTEISRESLGVVERHLEAVADMHLPFRIHLRGTGTFSPVSPVVFIAMSAGISQCEMLAADARRDPLAQQLRFPYHPHVTVAHHVDDVALDHAFETLKDFECVFNVGDFHLYLHGDDAVWRPVRSFVLGA